MSTLAGRVLSAGVVAKALAFIIGSFPEPIVFASDIVNLVGNVALLVGGAAVVLRWVRIWSEKLLWRVRRKLILSYIFIGVVPALLIICFFAISGMLVVYNVSVYIVRSRMTALVEEVRALADVALQHMQGWPTTAAELAGNKLTAQLAINQGANT